VSLIELKNVVKEYQTGGTTFRALHGVDLAIADGEFTALMGPSGSGKSTVLSLLGALNPPTSGEVRVDDIEIYKLPSEQLADFRSEYIGIVFQQFQLIPYLTAAQNVMLPLAITKISHAEQRAMAQAVLEKVGLGEKAERLPNQLSGGEQERVAIARAIVNEPPILLADEPTGALDTRTGDEIMSLFKDLHREGQTIIMVTHNPENAQHAGRVVEIRDGRIEGDRVLQAG
jgi:putative ABC transport system ATP-binding protein